MGVLHLWQIYCTFSFHPAFTWEQLCADSSLLSDTQLLFEILNENPFQGLQ